MSGFLLNMIQRHQGVVDTVQPRIRSMFESETTQPVYPNDFANATINVAKNNFDLNNIPQYGVATHSNAIIQAPEYTPEAPASNRLQESSRDDISHRATGYEPSDTNRLDTLNTQIEDILARLNRKSQSTKPSQDVFYEKLEIPQDVHFQSTTKLASPETRKPDGIKGILSRLQSEINRVAQSKQGTERDGRLPFVATKTGEIQPKPVTLDIRQESKIADSFESLNKPSKDSGRIEPVQANRQTGALLIPAWLTALQAELNHRWQETNTRSDSERVVNVSIGRVEIRATHPVTKQQSNVTEKPKGVLSLDDYLKQRESKGRP